MPYEPEVYLHAARSKPSTCCFMSFEAQGVKHTCDLKNGHRGEHNCHHLEGKNDRV